MLHFIISMFLSFAFYALIGMSLERSVEFLLYFVWFSFTSFAIMRMLHSNLTISYDNIYKSILLLASFIAVFLIVFLLTYLGCGSISQLYDEHNATSYFITTLSPVLVILIMPFAHEILRYKQTN